MKTIRYSEHPSVVVAGGVPHLKIFRYFRSDPTLPKHLVDGKVRWNGRSLTIQEYNANADGMSSYRRHQNRKREGGLMARCLSWIAGLFRRHDAPSASFDGMKSIINGNSLPSDGEIALAKLKTMTAKLLDQGQVALAKRLESQKNAIATEIVLVKNGLFHYIDESDVIRLLTTADSGIRIDFWNDYPDFVPDDVVEAKRMADGLRVFDNWCVMHFDPNGSALKQIEIEEYRRDPILFGMVEGSDRLYFVKDWTTKKDDLTVERMCGILGIEKLRDTRMFGEDSEYEGFSSELMDNIDAVRDQYGEADNGEVSPR